MNDKKSENPDVPSLSSPSIDKMAFIGDYIFLPYSFMNMNEDVPFSSHSSFLTSGSLFLPRSAWTIETVLKIIELKPHAFMGGEILDYQKTVVPKFLSHLREADERLWGELVKTRPEMDVEPNYVGRKALLSTLNFPIEWETSSNYRVRWRWDGHKLTTISMNAYDKTWGEAAMESIELSGVPDKDVSVKVMDNGWVNKNTVLLD